MKSNLKKIGNWFTTNNLWHKPFNDFSQKEIEGLCQIISENIKKPHGNIIEPCYVCGNVKFWRLKGDLKSWTCAECHPPVATDKKLDFLTLLITDMVDKR